MAYVLKDTESFESNLGDWTNVSSFSGWIRLSGVTGSSSTGPTSAYSGSYYIYVETSPGSGSFTSGNTDTIEYTLPEPNMAVNVNFYCHQYGAEQGTLYLQGYNGSSWVTIWSRTANSNSWVNFSVYSKLCFTKLRFRNVAAGGWHGDVALDYIRVYQGDNILYSQITNFSKSTAQAYANYYAYVIPDTIGFVYDTTSRSDPGNVAPSLTAYDDYREDTGPFYDTEGSFDIELGDISQSTLYYFRPFILTDGGEYVYGDEYSRILGEIRDVDTTTANFAAGSVSGSVGVTTNSVYMPTVTYSNFESSLDQWINVSSFSGWIRLSGVTGSSSTGPTSAYSGSYYIYVETSSGSGSYTSGNTDTIEHTLSTQCSGVVDFYYHQYGAEQGTLYLEQYNGSSWATIWSKHSSVNSWVHIQQAFTSATKLRFRNVAAGGWHGDVALDYIKVNCTLDRTGTFTSATIDVSEMADIGSGVITVGKTLGAGALTFYTRYSTDNGSNWSSWALVVGTVCAGFSNIGTSTSQALVQYKCDFYNSTYFGATPYLNDVTLYVLAPTQENFVRGFDEVLVVIDSFGKGISRSVVENLSVSTSNLQSMAKAFPEILAMAEDMEFVSSFTRTYADELGLGDVVAKAIARVLQDDVELSIDVSHAISAIMTGDVLGLDDSVSFDTVKSIMDTMSLSDQVATLVMLNRTLSEAVLVGDSNVVSMMRQLQESLPAADMISKAMIMAYSDGVLLDDSEINSISRHLAEELGLDEDMILHTIRDIIINEGVGLADTIATVKVLDRIISDTLALSDSRGLRPIITMVESFTLAGQLYFLKELDRLQQETLVISETIRFDCRKALADIMPIADAIIKSLGMKDLSDQFGLDDNMYSAVIKSLSEQFGLSAEFIEETFLHFFAYENLSINDGMIKAATVYRILSELFSMRDRLRLGGMWDDPNIKIVMSMLKAAMFIEKRKGDIETKIITGKVGMEVR